MYNSTFSNNKAPAVKNEKFDHYSNALDLCNKTIPEEMRSLSIHVFSKNNDKFIDQFNIVQAKLNELKDAFLKGTETDNI